MARQWQTDATLSHAPLLVLIAVFCLYQRRARLRVWDEANPAGFALMLVSAVVFALASRVDVLFLKAFSVIGLLTGTVWFLGGTRNLRVAAGSLGLLIFVVPYPAAIITRFQFFLQIVSSAYAALLSGLLGIPVQRDGVALAVIPPGAEKPVFTILVAQKCSGLASLLALLALAYLIAWHTPLPPLRRLPLVLLIFPLALFANAARLALILLAGSRGNAGLAQWVHDNEQPVLMLICGIGLGALRWALMTWANPNAAPAGRNMEEKDAVPVSPAVR
jgi:exosortase